MNNHKVNHPEHYNWLKSICGIEVIDIARHLNFNLGNVIKYVLRAGHKSESGYSDLDKKIEDLQKARWYIDDEIKFLMSQLPETYLENTKKLEFIKK